MIILKVSLLLINTRWVSCTIAGISYMDPMNTKIIKKPPEDDPCNPLYWYPREIPEYCNFRRIPKPEAKHAPDPVPQPIPVPVPAVPIPPAYPLPPPFPVYPPMYPMPPAPLLPPPIPMYGPPMPLPFGIPLAPTNPFLPVAGVPSFSYPGYPYYAPQQQIGMVPGIPGLVTDDGGINVLPFSDAYADLLDKNKRKMRRKKEYRDDYRRRKRVY